MSLCKIQIERIDEEVGSVEIYQKAKKRVKNYKSGIISDADIIIALEKEIDTYREKINRLREVNEKIIIDKNTGELEVLLLTGLSLNELINKIKSANIVLKFK